MRCLYFLSGFLFLFFPKFGVAQTYHFNANCQQAYRAFLAGKLDEGNRLTQLEKKQHPDNLIVVLLENYADYIRLTFNENESIYNEQKETVPVRLNALAKGNKQSPFHLLSTALIHLQWSMIRAKHGDNWNAVWDFRRSYLLLVQNKKQFPTFHETDIFLGASEALISTIPAGYRWISDLLGLRGNMPSGLQQLSKQVLSRKSVFADEANLYYIFLKHYLENDIKGAQELVEQLNMDVKNNHLNCFIAANLAINNKDAATAERILRERTNNSTYMPFPMLDYELGDAKLKRLDYTCKDDFQRYLKNTHSLFYIKDAWLSLAYIAYLQNNHQEMHYCLTQIKKQGNSESDADREALQVAEKGVMPDKDLLRARLLNDGGYNTEALSLLKVRTISSFKTSDEQLEYIYRLGRIHDELNLKEEALRFYKLAFNEAGKTSCYFPARAALQMGYIYEERQQKEEALRSFNQVLRLKGHQYKNSLDQKAKAAINRMH
jgi:hypothetical protein